MVKHIVGVLFRFFTGRFSHILFKYKRISLAMGQSYDNPAVLVKESSRKNMHISKYVASIY